MGYVIQYSPESRSKYPAKRKTRSLKRIIIVGLAALLLFFAVKYRTALGRLLLPGDPDITADALRGLVTNVREEGPGEAIATFCREIVDHATG